MKELTLAQIMHVSVETVAIGSDYMSSSKIIAVDSDYVRFR